VNFEISLVIGLILGSGYVVLQRILDQGRTRAVTGAFLVKWPTGMGRASVNHVKANTVQLTPPVMRALYPTPHPGAELLLKPLDGGPVRRAKFVAYGDAGWTIKLGL